ncbi:MAG TPA: hypothetical protein DET40_23580 [Lentisphaeria bacterium]|nr:MAG: hypothetical protein A2X45_23795 [Lentisphaerae bacterium GWF2_50_93]HCE46538.1 hypothetical protein [Lentisphaeria bacterium]
MKWVIIITAVCLIPASALFAMPKTVVSDSTITSESSGENTAIGNSNINTGVQASGAQISESEISAKTRANINANSSTVNTGVKAEGATIENSTLKANTNAGSINATNSRVSTGVEVSGARSSDLEANVSVGTINAKNSTVNVGSIKGEANGKAVSTNVGVGDVKARNETKNIGNVNLNAGPGSGGNSKVFKKDEAGGSRGQAETNIGNVTVSSDRVREVNVTVGDGGSMSEKIKERNKAKTYSDNDGVDPSGTKHIFVSDREKQKAEKEDGDAGNIEIKSDNRKVHKVEVFVE